MHHSIHDTLIVSQCDSLLNSIDGPPLRCALLPICGEVDMEVDMIGNSSVIAASCNIVIYSETNSEHHLAY